MKEITVGEAIYQLTNFEGTYETPSLEAIELAVESLKKQVPKKPIGAYKTCDTGEIDYWICPNCNYEHKTDWGSCDTDYCLNCGQAIDWSEV